MSRRIIKWRAHGTQRSTHNFNVKIRPSMICWDMSVCNQNFVWLHNWMAFCGTEHWPAESNLLATFSHFMWIEWLTNSWTIDTFCSKLFCSSAITSLPSLSLSSMVFAELWMFFEYTSLMPLLQRFTDCLMSPVCTSFLLSCILSRSRPLVLIVYVLEFCVCRAVCVCVACFFSTPTLLARGSCAFLNWIKADKRIRSVSIQSKLKYNCWDFSNDIN